MSENTNNNETIFRKETLERISSPEQLTDYLKITNPGIWVILTAVILLLAGLFAWTMIGTLETTATVKVIVDNDTAQIVPVNGDAITNTAWPSRRQTTWEGLTASHPWICLTESTTEP